MACSNGMVCGELNYARKHTGAADQEIKMQISSQIKNAQKAFDRIKKDKDALRTVILSEKQQAELLGRMFFDEDLISARQMSTVKDEMEKPSFDYKADQDNAWAFYNHVTHAYKSVHPRSWLSDTKNFHDFMTANVLTGMGIINTDTINTKNVIDENENDVVLDLNVPAQDHVIYPKMTDEEAQHNIKAQEESDMMRIEEIIEEEERENIEEVDEVDESYDFEI